MDLHAKGGGEAVCMNVLEALQADHDVTLLTLTDPDFGPLNDYFNAAVDPDRVTVRTAGTLAPALHRTFGLKYYILQNALLGQYACRHADEFDLLVSTINELGLGTDAVQYVHFPFDWTVSLDDREHIFHPTVESDSFYERLCTRVGAVDLDDLQSNVLLANSPWTADVVEDAYGIRPRIVYPPVDTDGFVDRDWDERENGFVTLGRIERSKRIVEIVRIVDGVRERGHDVHLHVVGPTVDETYREEVARLADDRNYVNVEGELPREELVELVCSHRYGIHGKEYEHFGMAVAELTAGGTVTFVPANGGQYVVVGDREELTYRSVPEAIDRIDHVLSNPPLQSELRGDPDEVRRQFGRERFRAEIREVVSGALQRASEQAGRHPAPAPRFRTGTE